MQPPPQIGESAVSQWRINKFWKGMGGTQCISPVVIFIANAHNAFYTGKGDLLK